MAARNAIDPLQIEWVRVGTLYPNVKNPRTHSRRQIKKIAASIREFGFLSPIIIDDAGNVLAGHGRLEAAKSEDLAFVPVVRIGNLTLLQKRAFIIADNKTAETGWDRGLLAIELGELIELLPSASMDISLTGFEPAEIDLLFADMADRPDAEVEADNLTLPEIATTKSGDLWLPGKHRLLCGDARDPAGFARVTNGELVAAVFTDPPYNVRVRSIGGRGRVRHDEFAFASGEMTTAQFHDFLVTTLQNGVDVSVPGAVHYICMDWRHIDALIGAGRDLYEAMLNLVVWNKTNAGQGSFYRSQHELIGVFRAPGSAHRNNVELGRFGRNRSNVWTYAGANTFAKGRLETLAAHPTVKPVSLVADALLDCTARGENVLDQFAGSGTTIIAAEKVGRVAFAIEYEPRYVDVAIQRWQKWTKQDAVLAGDGRTFEEVAAARRKSTAASTPGGHRRAR